MFKKSRKFLSFLFALIMLLSLVPISSLAANTDYDYVLSLSTETMSVFTGDSVEVTLNISSPEGSPYNAVQAAITFNSGRLQYSGSDANGNTTVTARQAGTF